VHTKLNFFEQQKINEIFSVIYQKIEREKLNKMAYLNIIFAWTDAELFAKYYLRSTIFRVKNVANFYSILAAVQPF